MEKTWPLAKGVATSEYKDRANLDGARRSYLSKSIHVDHVLRWSRFFSDEQMLVLTSEDFLERAADTLKRVLCFLDLPEWEPEAWEIRDKGRDGQGGGGHQAMVGGVLRAAQSQAL
jgi:hypothetical protein